MSLLLTRCAEPTCEFTWEGGSTRIDAAELEHREALARAGTSATGTPPENTADEDAPLVDPIDHAPHRGHELVVVRERWRWLRPVVVFNIVWIAISAYAATTSSTSMMWLAFVFPEIPAFRVAPAVPIAVIVIASFISISYAAMGARGTRFGQRFFAAMTMCGAVSAVASAAASGTILLLLGLAWRSS
ncbi:hypothetical protein [Microbacterium trichothecenolyticum]|uniref:Uncharacterized protein n=1 Tax=Microbacterium trichothecenolyticum TaxID=69370 RepID=A0ABU0TW05_MICTR|nr:hypothetical protein [Microbacterium trichothecenolyticum]MDQ1123107.1 hypothetical protein [Microbacterium trichothecenolyticum]